MDHLKPKSTVGQQPFGSSGFLGSKIGWGTGSSRMCDGPGPDSDGPLATDAATVPLQTAASSQSSGLEDDSIRAALERGINVFELGCVAKEPVATLRRLAVLDAAMRRLPELQPVLAIVRFGFRQMPKSPVDLEYRLQAQSWEEVLQWASGQVLPWFEQLRQQEMLSTEPVTTGAPAKLRLAWVWDDVDYRVELSNDLRNKIQHLVSQLQSLCADLIVLQGVGGFRWQSLTELISQADFELVLLHGFGMLGPDLVGGLSSICQRKGVMLLTTLPCYGGLLSQPLLLGPEHPASQLERLAAQTARIVAEEHGLSLPGLAWSFFNQNDSVDCSLIEMPTIEQVQRVCESFNSLPAKRSEALVIRHLQNVRRETWFE